MERTKAENIPLIHQYYSKIMGTQKWKETAEFLHRELPLGIRMNLNHPDWLDTWERIKNSLQQLGVETVPLGWIKGGYQINMCKLALKQDVAFASVHKLIQLSSDKGILTRQEVASMIPVELMDLMPHHTVLDLCAAPGSKSTQILEKLEYLSRLTPKVQSVCETQNSSLLVSNDIDTERSWILSHQVSRWGFANSLITNYPGQHFPDLHLKDSQKTRMLFDRVLVDAPCSADGTIRKLSKKWRDWSTSDARRLQPIQIDLLCRAIQLTKPGGMIVYSTCSLNPIEVSLC